MIQQFADWLIFDLLGMDANSRLGEAVNFFVYDSTKIILLLFSISIVMGIVNAYFPIERLRNYLSSHRLYGFQYLLASIFGAITPFCSCSSIPLFIGFVKGGIPLGVTFAFLITSPLVNEVAVAMFLGTFGWQVTAIYVACGIVMGMVGGFVLGKLKLERYLSPWILQMQQMQMQADEAFEAEHVPFMKRLPAIHERRPRHRPWGDPSRSARHRHWRSHPWVRARRFLCRLHAEGRIAGSTGKCTHRRADVCQCCWNRPCGGGIRCQGHSSRHSPRLHDVSGRTLPARSHNAQEGDDLAAHRHLLRHSSIYDHDFRVDVQSDIVDLKVVAMEYPVGKRK